MDISLTGTLLAIVLLFGHLVAVAVGSLVAYGVLNVARLQPDIRYLFWPMFIGGSVAWGYTARELFHTHMPFSTWSHSAFTWYAVLALGGLCLGVFLQRRRL